MREFGDLLDALKTRRFDRLRVEFEFTAASFTEVSFVAIEIQ